jgi:hypothetical protein
VAAARCRPGICILWFVGSTRTTRSLVVMSRPETISAGTVDQA